MAGCATHIKGIISSECQNTDDTIAIVIPFPLCYQLSGPVMAKLGIL